jgi:hypothetical protein
MPDHIPEVWWGGQVEKDGLQGSDPAHGMRHALWYGDKISCSHNLARIADAELDLPLNNVQEMMACWMRVKFDTLFQAIDPDIHRRRLGKGGELKPFVLLKRLVIFDMDDVEIQLTC